MAMPKASKWLSGHRLAGKAVVAHSKLSTVSTCRLLINDAAIGRCTAS